MQINPIEQSFALHVKDVNAWNDLPAEQARVMSEAWSTSGLMILRRQSLSEQELVVFSRLFGDPVRIVRKDWQAQGEPEVILISNLKTGAGRSVGGLGAGELGWHTDQSYVMNPATGSILYMVEMPPEGGCTYWANLRLAYQALPEDTRTKIESLHGVYDYLARQSTYDDEAPMSDALRRETPLVTHPLVQRHPVTGERSLYLDPTTMSGVVGLSDDEGMSLIEQLCAHATRPEFVYKHEWQVGDVVMWDNGFLMHRRDPFDVDSLRLLKRTTLKLDPERHLVPETALYEC